MVIFDTEDIMRPQYIVIGDYYVFKEHPNYSYAKALAVLKAKQIIFTWEYGKLENPLSYAVIYCEHSVQKNDTFGFRRYFRPCDLLKP